MIENRQEAQILSWPRDRVVMWDIDYQRVTRAWHIHEGIRRIELGIYKGFSFNTTSLPKVSTIFPGMELSLVTTPAYTIKGKNEFFKEIIHKEKGT